MKVIDLLNKIANGEETPGRIIYNTYTYWYEECNKNYYRYVNSTDDDENIIYLFDDFVAEILNDEVKIIEDVLNTPNSIRKYLGLPQKEEKKIPKKIEYYNRYDECVVKDKFYQDKIGSLVDEIIIDKINEIIDYFNSKGE